MTETRAAAPDRNRQGSTPRRDDYFDNVKGVLIFLVVVGHAVSTVHAPGAEALGAWIYFFHMPAFVFVCGLMSRGYAVIDQHRVQSLMRGLLLPYILFQGLLVALDKIDNPTLDISVTQFLTPVWPMWFLPALFGWRMLTPFLMRVRWPLPLAICGSVAVGMSAALDWTLGVNRMISFLPFFALGLLWDPRAILRRLRTPFMRWLAACLLIAALPFASIFREHFSFRWLFWSDTYEMLKIPAPFSYGMKLMLMVIASVMILALLLLVPARQSFISRWGRYSMYPLLLHGVVVRVFRMSGLVSVFDFPLGVPVFLIVCFALTGLLASRWARTTFRLIVEPPALWLSKP